MFGLPPLACKVPRIADSVDRFVNLLKPANWIRHNASFQVHLTKSFQKHFNQLSIHFQLLTDFFKLVKTVQYKNK